MASQRKKPTHDQQLAPDLGLLLNSRPLQAGSTAVHEESFGSKIMILLCLHLSGPRFVIYFVVKYFPTKLGREEGERSEGVDLFVCYLCLRISDNAFNLYIHKKFY